MKTAILGLALLNVLGTDQFEIFQRSNITSFADGFRGHFKSGSFLIPHPEKVHKGGEDALFVRDKLITVADGVGGWANHGVDPGLYSKQLVRLISEVYDEKPDQTPKQILWEANRRTTHTGTSTCVIAILHPENRTIATTCLGDSSYLLVRPSNEAGLTKIFRSEEQQKRFNFPYQCGTGGDDPKLAVDNQHSVQNNDIIVMGSDGVFDNCFDDEIIDILKKRVDPAGNLADPQEASEAIARLAEAHGMDKRWRSPFQIAAEKAYRRRVFQGGKQDDISVIVSQIMLE